MNAKLRNAALATALLGARQVNAGTVCVNPGLATCQPTIQAGVDAAAPGDTVLIAAGVYYENVAVPAAKSGLKLAGVSRTGTILDASSYADRGIVHTDSGISVMARDVQVRNLTIRNGHNAGVVLGAPGGIVQGVNLFGQDFVGVAVGPETAYGAQILGNDIRSATYGVLTLAYGTIVKGNTIADVGAHGVVVNGGDGAQIVANRISNATSGVTAIADGVVVASNDIRYARTGVSVSGSNPVIERNRVLGCGVDGIEATCVQCFGGSVAYNSVTDASGRGILAATDSAGLKVQGNVILRTGGDGIALDGVGIFATQNRVSDAGADAGAACISSRGTANVVSHNTAARCGAAGYYLSGDGHYLDHNQAAGTYENGFTIDGDSGNPDPSAGNSLVANTATGDAGQGFAVIGGASGTLLADNVGTKNRLDYCDDGSSTVAAPDNTFGTTAATSGTDCLIAH